MAAACARRGRADVDRRCRDICSGRCPHGAAPWRTNQRRDREALTPPRASGAIRPPTPAAAWAAGVPDVGRQVWKLSKGLAHKGLDTLRAPGHSFCLFCGQDRSKRDNQGASDHGVGQHSAQIAVVARLVARPSGIGRLAHSAAGS